MKARRVLPVNEEQYDCTVNELGLTNLGGTAEVLAFRPNRMKGFFAFLGRIAHFTGMKPTGTRI